MLSIATTFHYLLNIILCSASISLLSQVLHCISRIPLVLILV